MDIEILQNKLTKLHNLLITFTNNTTEYFSPINDIIENQLQKANKDYYKLHQKNTQLKSKLINENKKLNIEFKLVNFNNLLIENEYLNLEFDLLMKRMIVLRNRIYNEIFNIYFVCNQMGYDSFDYRIFNELKQLNCNKKFNNLLCDDTSNDNSLYNDIKMSEDNRLYYDNINTSIKDNNIIDNTLIDNNIIDNTLIDNNIIDNTLLMNNTLLMDNTLLIKNNINIEKIIKYFKLEINNPIQKLITTKKVTKKRYKKLKKIKKMVKRLKIKKLKNKEKNIKIIKKLIKILKIKIELKSVIEIENLKKNLENEFLKRKLFYKKIIKKINFLCKILNIDFYSIDFKNDLSNNNKICSDNNLCNSINNFKNLNNIFDEEFYNDPNKLEDDLCNESNVLQDNTIILHNNLYDEINDSVIFNNISCHNTEGDIKIKDENMDLSLDFLNDLKFKLNYLENQLTLKLYEIFLKFKNDLYLSFQIFGINEDEFFNENEIEIMDLFMQKMDNRNILKDDNRVNDLLIDDNKIEDNKNDNRIDDDKGDNEVEDNKGDNKIEDNKNDNRIEDDKGDNEVEDNKGDNEIEDNKINDDNKNINDEIKKIIKKMKIKIDELQPKKESYVTIIKKIEKRNKYIQKIIEFEKLASNPERLFKNSVQLINEERFRKNAIPYLLKIENNLINEINEYENIFGDFIINGIKYKEMLEDEIKNRIVNRSVFMYNKDTPRKHKM